MDLMVWLISNISVFFHAALFFLTINMLSSKIIKIPTSTRNKIKPIMHLLATKNGIIPGTIYSRMIFLFAVPPRFSCFFGASRFRCRRREEAKIGARSPLRSFTALFKIATGVTVMQRLPDIRCTVLCEEN